MAQGKINGVSPADRNKAIQTAALRILARLLRQASDPAFRGTVGVEVSSKDGRFAEPKATIVRFGGD